MRLGRGASTTSKYQTRPQTPPNRPESAPATFSRPSLSRRPQGFPLGRPSRSGQRRCSGTRGRSLHRGSRTGANQRRATGPAKPLSETKMVERRGCESAVAAIRVPGSATASPSGGRHTIAPMRASLTSLPGRIVEALIVAALLALGGHLLDLGDLTVPVWAATVAATAFVAFGFAAGRLLSRGARRSAYYAEHVREAVAILRRGVVGEIRGVTWALWGERGIMGPACHWLARRRGEEIRTSVRASR